MEKITYEARTASAPSEIEGKTEDKIRVGIYLRVSSRKGRDQDVERQEYGINKHLAANPHKQLWDKDKGVYIDYASGGGWSRRELRRIIADMKRSYLDEIIFYEVDRLGRDTRESLNYIHDVNDLGCSIFVCDDNTYARKGTDGWLRLEMKIVYAEYELTKIISRTVSGNERKKAALEDAAKELGYDYLRVGRPGIVEMWIKDPLGRKQGKQGFVVAPNKAYQQRFKRLWDAGLEVVDMQSQFPNVVAPTCESWRINAAGKVVKRKGAPKKQDCKCHKPVTSKTIHTTRAKLGLPKRHEGAWGHDRASAAVVFGIDIKDRAASS